MMFKIMKIKSKMTTFNTDHSELYCTQLFKLKYLQHKLHKTFLQNALVMKPSIVLFYWFSVILSYDIEAFVK